MEICQIASLIYDAKQKKQKIRVQSTAISVSLCLHVCP